MLFCERGVRRRLHWFGVGRIAFILLNFAFTMLRSKVDFDLKALQREYLKIMDMFDAVCRAHGLRYYMACGTMLGTVRHKGFIPWDDDVDLYMPRPDYDTLCLHSAEWLPADMKLCNQDTDITFPHYYGKVKDTGTTFVERTYLGHYGGAWIDIFPIDGAPENEAERKRHVRRFSGGAGCNIMFTAIRGSTDTTWAGRLCGCSRSCIQKAM